jgi:hypothetical protein
VEATNKKLLENHHSASLPPQSLVVFAFKKYMKKRVKIFGAEFTSKLEELVNNFLSVNDNYDLIDIKYSDTQNAEGDYWCSALIIYTTENV